jgi:hypothetical protein
MRGSGTTVAINAAAYGLMAWHFLTAASMLLTASVAFAVTVQGEVLVTAPAGLFLAYVGVQFARRFAQTIHGDSFLL